MKKQKQIQIDLPIDKLLKTTQIEEDKDSPLAIKRKKFNKCHTRVATEWQT